MKSCYQCDHRLTCRFAVLLDNFPYKDDDKIGPRLQAITKANAEACAFYTPMKSKDEVKP